MKRIVIPAFVSCLLASSIGMADDTPNWGYKGKTSPEHWGEISKEFKTCSQGENQSPIDITTQKTKKAHLGHLKTDYKASSGERVNNGHSIQVNLDDGGSIDTPSGQYEIAQFHFHTPSEERIDGITYPLVAHLVHENEDGEAAVVAVLFKIGDENPALKKIFADLPHRKAQEKLSHNFNPDTLLPENKGYYTYGGSLTTPPCSEGVTWYILKQPVELSREQLAEFQSVFPMNARPIQPVNGRTIKSVD